MANHIDKELIVKTYDLIENLLKDGRLHMSGVAGSNPRMVCPILGVIWAATGEAKALHWPDPEAEKAAAAKQDIAKVNQEGL